jgi:hypothetical protein
MDFAKFVSMLANSGFFSCRVDNLGDPFEGSVSHADHIEAVAAYHPSVVAASADLTKTSSLTRVMVNCWHMNEHESAAMWNQYSLGGKAIAVRSTYEKLRACLDDSVKIGIVKYIEFPDVSHLVGQAPLS